MCLVLELHCITKRFTQVRYKSKCQLRLEKATKEREENRISHLNEDFDSEEITD